MAHEEAASAACTDAADADRQQRVAGAGIGGGDGTEVARVAAGHGDAVVREG